MYVEMLLLLVPTMVILLPLDVIFSSSSRLGDASFSQLNFSRESVLTHALIKPHQAISGWFGPCTNFFVLVELAVPRRCGELEIPAEIPKLQFVGKPHPRSSPYVQ